LVRLNVASAASTVQNLRIESSCYTFLQISEQARNAGSERPLPWSVMRLIALAYHLPK
jgi:hypothetical protein